MTRERHRWPRGLKLMVTGGGVGLAIAIAGGVGFLVMVVALFADADRIEGEIRGDLAGETEEPGVLVVDLPRGDHVVWVINRSEIPHDPDVALDLEVSDVDGVPVPLRDPGNKISYQDPGTSAELFMTARFDVERAGRFRIQAVERPGSYPVERIGVGRHPPFGHPMIYGVGALVAFGVAGFGLMATTGLWTGAVAWAVSRSKATLAG